MECKTCIACNTDQHFENFFEKMQNVKIVKLKVLHHYYEYKCKNMNQRKMYHNKTGIKNYNSKKNSF